MNAAKQSEPSEIELLLPWYAAGTLDARESQQVERALASDPELAARYEWVRAELEQETHVSEAAGAPSARDVKTLFAKIDALPAQKSRASIDIGARIAEFLAALSPRTLGVVGDGGGARHRAAGGISGRLCAQGEKSGWL